MAIKSFINVVYCRGEEGKGPSLSPEQREQVHELVVEQTREWSEMVMLQLTEEHDVRKEHIEQQGRALKKLLLEAQAQQQKELEVKQEK